MKTLVMSAVALVLGLVTGWFVENHRAQREKSKIVELMVDGGESSDSVHAARAVRAIQLIESGEAQDAIRLLSTPIADYYSRYTETATNDERRMKLRGLIEQLAKTNQIVAARIAEATKDGSKQP